MSDKRSEKLFEGISYIRDEIVEEAEAARPRKSRPAWVKWTALAACLCLVVFGGLRMGLLGGMKGGGSEPPAPEAAPAGDGGISEEINGISYMRYEGPVMPLTALSSVEGLTAERDVTLDFSPYGDNKSRCIVADKYTLTNSSDRDLSFTAVYPFAAELMSRDSALPSLRLDGAELEGELHVGAFMGSISPESWTDYKAAVEGGYMDSAFAEKPAPDEKIIVYKLTDICVPPESSDLNDPATLNMEFAVDRSRTKLMTLGFSGGSNFEDGRYGRSLWANHTESAYLLVSGEDIGEYKLQGYKDGGCEPGNELEGVTAKVERYESTLGEFLNEVLPERVKAREEMLESREIASCLSIETYTALVGEELSLRREELLEDTLSTVQAMRRIMYLSAEITVPAGGSAELEAVQTKDASIDFIGQNEDRDGYDLVTRLGSALEFTRQGVSINGTENIRIAGQDFGFDLENGITSVELDLAKEHYFIELFRRG